MLQDNPPAVLDLEGMATTFYRPQYPGIFSQLLTEVWPRTENGARLVMAHRPDRVPGAFCRELAERYLHRLIAYADSGTADA